MKVRKKLVRKRRSPEQRREDARRFATNVSRTLIVVAIIGALVVAANRWSQHQELRNIRITGRVVLDSSEIMERAGIKPGVEAQSLNLAEIQSRVAAHPYLSRASVYRDANGTLVIDVTERAPVAMAMLTDGTPVYLDSHAVELPYRFSSATFDVPVLTGIERPLASGTAKAGDTAMHVHEVAMQIDSMVAREAIGVVRTIQQENPALYREISEVRREANGEYTLLLADGAVPVKAGYPIDIAHRVQKLDLFMRTAVAARGANSAEYVDLRWDGQVVVRWREAPAANAMAGDSVKGKQLPKKPPVAPVRAGT